MLTEFQKRKMSLAFYKFDSSKDGIVESSDLEQYGKEIANHLGLEAGSSEYQATVDRVSTIWDAYFKGADADGDGQVTIDEYLNNVANFLSQEGAADMGIEANSALFDAIDLDGSGEIQLNEFKAFVMPMGVSEADAELAFSKLDLDGNGDISRDEFAQNLYDYYASNDPNALGNWFYGGY